MGYFNLLTDSVDLYQLKHTPSFIAGVEVSGTYSYDPLPNVQGVPCLIVDSGYKALPSQGEPNEVVNQYKLIHLMPNVEVKLNDRVKDRQNGVWYQLGEPRNIRSHHIEVHGVRVSVFDAQ